MIDRFRDLNDLVRFRKRSLFRLRYTYVKLLIYCIDYSQQQLPSNNKT